MKDTVEIRIRLYSKDEIEKYNQFINLKTSTGTKNKVLSDLFIAAIEQETLGNYSTTINEMIKNNLNNLLNYKISALIKYLDKNNAESIKREMVIDEEVTYIMNQIGLLVNDLENHNNPSAILRLKPEWIKKYASEISEKLNHFTNIKEYHDIFSKENK